jgi:hypothetical protein
MHSIFKYNQQDATLHNVFISVKCCTPFRRVLRPSSGAQNCIHSIGYLPGLTAALGCRGRVGTGSSKAWQVSDAVCTVLSSWLLAEDPPETRRSFHRNKYIVLRCILLVILENTFTMHGSMNVKVIHSMYIHVWPTYLHTCISYQGLEWSPVAQFV